jgi:hypothetical protein
MLAVSVLNLHLLSHRVYVWQSFYKQAQQQHKLASTSTRLRSSGDVADAAIKFKECQCYMKLGEERPALSTVREEQATHFDYLTNLNSTQHATHRSWNASQHASARWQ